MVFEVYVICIFTIFRYSVRNSDTMNHALLAKKKKLFKQLINFWKIDLIKCV